MTKDFEVMQSGFNELVKRIKYYSETLALLFWDLRTGAPKKCISNRSEVIGMLSAEVFALSTSEEMGEYLAYFEEAENNARLDPITKAVVRECRKEYDRFRKIPADKYKAYAVLTSESEVVWEEAKKKDDFEMFRPYLEKIVGFNIEFVGLWGFKDNKYDTLLEFYEPGMTVEKLDRIFAQLKERIVPLVAKIRRAENAPDSSCLKKYFDPMEQERYGIEILKEMGYDFEAGRLDESEHPFTTEIGPGDVRITTHYYPNSFSSALFSCIHEGGHALYEQNISEELKGTPLHSGTSMGVHESQSRFWENMIGRSYSFWKCHYEGLKAAFPAQFANVTMEQFYRAINKVEPSLIRVEADEVTYNLHIMIRYEIEKALINEEIKVEDLPEIWNEKMKAYLGIVPADNATGVLQDVHWSGGSFGYFPSYTLGNIYSAQICHAIRKALPDFDEIICSGELYKIKAWLGEKIHRHGKLLEPAEILKSVTGEEINPRYLIDYLEKKYMEIYIDNQI